MRRAFISALVELAGSDSRVVLLTADLGYTVVEPFAEAFPERFFNVGVAEQNMLGVATGLAEAGFVPFCYSIVSFAALRPYEFFRNGAVHQRLPVRLVGVGGGLEYGTAGPSHYGLEDLGVMRVLPGLTVLAPADHLQANAALRATWDLPGPVYYRLGKDEQSFVPGLDGRYRADAVEVVRDGTDVVLLTTGSLALEAPPVCDQLAAEGITARLVVVPQLAPPPTEHLTEVLRGIPAAVTYEEHYATGGLGSLVAEVIAERGLSCRLARLGARLPEDGAVGSAAYMREASGLGSDALAAAARRMVREA